MRYQTIKSFEKHLEARHSISKFYLILHPSDLERRDILKKILTSINPHPGTVTFLKGNQTTIQEIQDLLNSPNLFGADTIVVVEDLDDLEKSQLEELNQFLNQGDSFGRLIATAQGKLAIASSFEKEGILLDMTDEKSWDKEKRCVDLSCELAAKSQKILNPDAASLLVERIGVDPSLIATEMAKLICHVGARPLIDRSDVFRMTPLSKEETIWHFAENIVWEKGNFDPIQAVSLHALIPAMRQQLNIGLKINELQSTPKDQWSSFLPKMWPKTLEKRKIQAVQLGKSYFQKGLSILFKIELLSRTGSTQEAALIDLFRSQLHSS